MGKLNGNGETNSFVIGKNTKINLGIALALGVMIVSATLAWGSLKSDLRSINGQLQRIHGDRWTKAGDHLFMQRYSSQNAQVMPEHRRSGN